MPKLSDTMTEGVVATWNKNVGDEVKSGEVLAEIETDKATRECEAVDEGTMGKLLVAEGTEGVKVNEAIAILLEEGDSADAAVAAPAPAAAAAAPAEAAPAAAAPSAPATVAAPIEPDWPEGTKMKSMTVREALREAMAEEMRTNDKVFLMGEEVGEYQGAYKISQGLLDEFGARRVIDTPITEAGFTGLAVGAAWGGTNPIVEFMTFNFAMQAIDHIVNSAAKTLYMSGGQMPSPIVFRGANGAAARVGAQHSQCYAAWYSQLPGLKVVMPYTAADAKGLLKAAIRDQNPVVFLENEILYGRSFEVPDMEDFTVPIGKARIAREGSDLTIVSFGIGMTYALEAAERLASEGINAEVIDLRTIRPMDTDAILNSVRKTNRLITVEEGFPQGSVGNYITSVVMEQAFDYLDAPVLNLCGKDVPMPYAANLEKLALVTTDEVVEAAKKVTYR